VELPPLSPQPHPVRASAAAITGGVSTASLATTEGISVRSLVKAIASTPIRVCSFTTADRSGDSGWDGVVGA